MYVGTVVLCACLLVLYVGMEVWCEVLVCGVQSQCAVSLIVNSGTSTFPGPITQKIVATAYQKLQTQSVARLQI